MAGSTPSSLLSDAGQIAREGDCDRYLCCLYAPASCREALFALLAFHVELARIPEQVSQEMLGLIRLTWWREALDELYGERPPRRHAVLEALQPAIREFHLTRAHFDALLSGREEDLDPDPPPTLDALEAYAEQTSSALLYLWLEVLGIKEDAALHVARHLGIAWGLAGLMRAVPHHAAREKVFLPADLIEREATFENLAALRQAVEAVCERAETHLAGLRNYEVIFTRDAMPVRLLAVAARHHLKRLRRVHHNPYDARLKGGGFALQMAILWRAMFPGG